MQLQKVIPWLLVAGAIAIIAPKYLSNNLDKTPSIVKVSDSQSAVKFSQSQRCEVTRISDGDTIACTNGQKIRFCGIDAPEKAQPLGEESKQYLTNLLQGKEVIISPVETDRYNRLVGEVFVKVSADSEEETFVNAEMVRAGMAYHYAQYSNSCAGRSQIIDAENEARTRAIGVWSGNHQKPWDYRKTTKK